MSRWAKLGADGTAPVHDMLISAMTTKRIAESRGMAGREWERYFTKRLGESTAWPSFTDFPTDRECCLGNSRVTLVGLIIAIVGVAFMLGGIPLLA